VRAATTQKDYTALTEKLATQEAAWLEAQAALEAATA
jgi:hypothetical protein